MARKGNAHRGWLPGNPWSSDVSELAEAMRDFFAEYDSNADGFVDVDEFVAAQGFLADASGAKADSQALVEVFQEMKGAQVRGQIGFTEFFQLQVEHLTAMEVDEFKWPKLIRWCVQQVKLGKQRTWQRTIDAEIASLSCKARALRCKEPRGVQEEQALRGRLRELSRQRRRELAGKVIVQGTVSCQGALVQGASVRLVAAQAGECLADARSNNRGGFELRAESRPGRVTTLTAQKKGYAWSSLRVSGEGVRQVRFELLPLVAGGTFRAEAGHAGTVEFRDPKSGARFDVPVGELLKDGCPFSGSAAFGAAVIDTHSRDGVEAMPPLAGRTVAGAAAPMQSLGAVFTEIRDKGDGASLQLRPGGLGIQVSLQSRAPLPPRQPSLWHYNERLMLWDQGMQPLQFDGSELPPPDPDAESGAVPPVEVGEESLGREQLKISNALDAGRGALDAQREGAGKPKVCTCGFEAKRAIMHLVRESHGLPLSDPPKRIFAGTEPDGRGGVQFGFPYLLEAERRRSAETASSHPEVVLSQHLAEIAAVLGKTQQDGASAVRESRFYSREATRRAIPSLRRVAAWMLDGAHVTDAKTGEPVHDVEPTVLKIAVLERLAASWARSGIDTSPPPTLVELREALSASAGDVAEALFSVALAQARRDEVARVRRRLLAKDARMVARYSVVEQALDESDGSVELAVERLACNPSIIASAEKLRVREALTAIMPMAYPSTREVEEAMEAAGKAKKEACHELGRRQAVADERQGEVLEAQARLAELHKEKTKEGKEAAAKLAEELAALEEAVASAQRDVQSAEETIAASDDPMRAAEVLAGRTSVREKASEAQKTWAERLRDGSRTHQLDFQVTETGWDNVDAPLSPAAGNEWFPPRPPVLCPGQVSAHVVGAFDDSLPAARASACGVRYRGVDCSQQVQPDGIFSLVTLAGAQFELRTHKADGTEGCTFGPFVAEQPGKITYLGLLSPAGSGKWDEVMTKVDVVLPPLEFPPTSSQVGAGKCDAATAAGEGRPNSVEGRFCGLWKYGRRGASATEASASARLAQSCGAFTIAADAPREGEECGLTLRDGEWEGEADELGHHDVSFRMGPGGEGGGRLICRRSSQNSMNVTFIPDAGTEEGPMLAVRAETGGERCTCFDGLPVGDSEF